MLIDVFQKIYQPFLFSFVIYYIYVYGIAAGILIDIFFKSRFRYYMKTERKFKSIGCIVFFIGLFILLLFIAFILISDMTRSSKLEQYNDAIKQGGAMTTTEEILDNYKLSEDIDSSATLESDSFSGGSARKDTAATQLEDLPGTATLWSETYKKLDLKYKDDKNLYPLFWQENYWETLSAQQKRMLKEEIENNSAIIEEMYYAAANTNYDKFMNSSKLIFSWQIPNITNSGYRDLAKLFVYARGLLAVEDGDTTEALRCADLGIKTAKNMLRFPIMVYVMVGVVIYGGSVELIQECISGEEISEGSLRDVIKIAEPSDFKTALGAAFDLERVAAAQYLSKAAKGQLTEEEDRFLPKTDYAILNSAINLLMAPVYKDDIVFLQKQNRIATAALSKPYIIGKDDFKQIENNIFGLSKIHFAAAQLSFLGTKIYRSLCQKEAKGYITQIAAACKIFKAKTGDFPIDISELVPHYLRTIPKDPFSGREFIYRRLAEGGFILYSVGDNGNDDTSEFDAIDYLLDKRFSKILLNNASKSSKETYDDILWVEKPAAADKKKP